MSFPSKFVIQNMSFHNFMLLRILCKWLFCDGFVASCCYNFQAAAAAGKFEENMFYAAKQQRATPWSSSQWVSAAVRMMCHSGQNIQKL